MFTKIKKNRYLLNLTKRKTFKYSKITAMFNLGKSPKTTSFDICICQNQRFIIVDPQRLDK